jgi:phage/plasmid-associated DNA primase
MPGILAWAVTGVFKWQEKGKLESPEKVKAAGDDYQKDQDVVRRWAEECCEMGNSEFQEGASVLYNAYKSWAIQGGEHPISATRFGKRLQELGFEGTHTMSGKMYQKIKIIRSEIPEGYEENERF